MSRRDTIIVAALINAGLLIILFVSALKNPSKAEAVALSSEKNVVREIDAQKALEPKVTIGDEVDHVLREYSKQNPLQDMEQKVIAIQPQVVEQQSPVEPLSAMSQSFVDDLTALTQAQQQVPQQENVIASAPAPSSGFEEVRVKKGDVLEKIARSHHISVQELMRINKLSSSNLRIGQVLKVPASVVAARVAPAKVQSDTSAKETGVQMYTVKTGDNPWTIAVKNHMKVEDLLRLNNMDEAKARKLKPGDQIRIR